jgi:hypothetical protein
MPPCSSWPFSVVGGSGATACAVLDMPSAAPARALGLSPSAHMTIAPPDSEDDDSDVWD